MVGMKDGDKWTLHEKDAGETTFRVRVIEAPKTRYNENGIRIRTCRGCFSRMARINPSKRLWSNEEERLAMIEAGDLEENTYWCEGHHRPNAPDDSWDVEAHEWVKTEPTQQYKAKQAAERAEEEKRWAAQRVKDEATAKAAGMTLAEWRDHIWNERFGHLGCDCQEEGCEECEEDGDE